VEVKPGREAGRALQPKHAARRPLVTGADPPSQGPQWPRAVSVVRPLTGSWPIPFD
jgi:hypothetical protein